MYMNLPGIAGGLQERIRSDVVTVGTTTTIVSSVRNTAPKRRVITIRNTSDDASKVITVSQGNNPAINNAGIVLRQYESFTDSQDGSADQGGYDAYQGQFNAICAVAGGQLSIFER